jgi:hypothetical protein
MQNIQMEYTPSLKVWYSAVVIVSMWLFGAGLIDELLANGADGSSLQNRGSIMDNQTISSINSSEGIEVGAHGFSY